MVWGYSDGFIRTGLRFWVVHNKKSRKLRLLETRTRQIITALPNALL